jgi:hypothetical protein
MSVAADNVTVEPVTAFDAGRHVTRHGDHHVTRHAGGLMLARPISFHAVGGIPGEKRSCLMNRSRVDAMARAWKSVTTFPGGGQTMFRSKGQS